MKKLICMFACVALLLFAAVSASAEVKPGDIVTISLSVTNNSAATSAIIGIQLDSGLIYQGSSGSNGFSAPDSASAGFIYMGFSPFSSGTFGTVTVKVDPNATSGTYRVRAIVWEALDIDGNEVSLSVSGGSVTVTAPVHTHSWDKGTVTTEPTCEGTGVRTYKCECGATTTETIAALGHTWDKGTVTTEPTCEGTGVRTYKCSCGATTTETIAALGHTWDNGTVTTEPTCEGTGVRTYKCSCGETGTLPIAALGHDWDNGTVTTQPTCIENGLRTYTCKNDPSHTTTGVEPATGKHTLSEDSVVVEATCTTDGSITGYCVDCGKVMNKETVPATGHKWDEGVVTTPATCEAAGVKTYTCKNDASHTQTETLKALGHAWDEGVVTIQPTCEAAGVKTYTCKNDASHTRTESIKALGHTWGEWVETKPVQDDVDGEKQRTCTVCGKVETAVIPAEVWYHMTVCTKGIRFRDLENPVTDEWYMFTPVDLSVDGEQVLPLVAGNMHIVGELTITVFEGEVTVTYELVNNSAIYKLEEFMTFLPSLAEVTELDFENMTNFAFGEPISIHDELGNDTKVLLLLRNQVVYEEKTRGLSMYEEKEEDYKLFVEELKLLMD